MKSKLILLALTMFTFLAPLKGLFVLISFAVIIDTLFAMYVVYKQKGIRHIISTKFFNLAVKTWFYLGSILLGYLVDVYVFDGSFMGVKSLMSKTICVLWLSIEVKSIDETSQKLGNRPFLEVIRDIVIKLKSFKKDLNDLQN